jgi:uncharacterized membrane protein
MDEIGPVDYAIIAFPGSKFKGDIAPALADLVDAGVVRIIDATFVAKEENGEVFSLELTELDPEVQAAFERVGIEIAGLFSDEDIEAAGEVIAPGSSAALIVWENLWARKLADAVRSADGELLDFGRIPHEVVQAAREWAVSTDGQEALA